MGHFYKPPGIPIYTVPRKDGKGERDTTITDARKLGLVPGVTTIGSIPSSYHLEKWKQEQLIRTILREHPKGQNEVLEDYISRIRMKTRNTAQDKGSHVHSVLETILQKGAVHTKCDILDYKNADHVFLEPVIDLLRNTFGTIVKWIPEKSFAHPLGYGGRVDLHSEDGNYIIDFKGKDTDKLDDIPMYDSYSMQLAACRRGLDFKHAKCYNLFISLKKKGEIMLYEWEEPALIRSLGMFDALLAYWKLANNYDSAF